MSILGNGVVIDLPELLKEIEELRENGVEVKGTLHVSARSHLVMPWHRLIDQLREAGKGEKKIGTTGRGIGPAYEDKVGRRGIRMGDLRHPKQFLDRLEEIIAEKNAMLNHLYDASDQCFDPASIHREYLEYFERIESYVTETPTLVNSLVEKGRRLLFEGAQGTFLDIDHGTYPFVTSSNTVSGNACAGGGIGPRHISDVVGIVKAYTTRVGSGPFPTELLDQTGDSLRSVGQEFGATTGRPRRCGWFDAVLVRYAVRLNGITSLALTKLDILDEFETLKLCVGYRMTDGSTHTDFPFEGHEDVEPIYEELPGWKTKTAGLTKYNDLPMRLLDYLKRIEELVGAPASIISTGPKREDTIVLNPDQFWKS
jgi:adenylosuccinate synthase